MNKYFSRLTVLAAIAMTACAGKTQSGMANTADATAHTPPEVSFNADSAFAFVAGQVAFGPRVPNTDAHIRCGDWLVTKLGELNASNITEQKTTLTAWDGTPLNVRNISAQYNPMANKRILLLSHWDSRPWADQDPDPANRNKPIDGANDGASGVGVILEVARCISQTMPNVGIDILLVDAEDYGTRADVDDQESSWCLGTQYWAANPTVDINLIRYAVLLDMVGGRDAVFPREYFSQYYAPAINDKIWKAAQTSGYAGTFSRATGTPVIDDHIYLLKSGIAAVDIIETNHPETGGFNPTWHTMADNMDNIDPKTLKAVGQTLINLIYSE